MPYQTLAPSINHRPDRLAYLWLALSVALLPFSNGRWAIAMVAWLAPVFLLRFVRTQPRLRGLTLAVLANLLGYALIIFVMAPFGVVTDLILTVSLGVINTVPYLLDRLLVAQLDGLLGTLVFPLAVTTAWYLIDMSSPDGTLLNPAFTQYGDLPLMQLVSVTGLWGIIFLMSWLASIVNWAWEHSFVWVQVRPGLLLYGGLLAVVLVGGGVRLVLFPPQGATVRIAGVTALHHNVLLPSGNFGALLDEKTTSAQRQAVRPVLDEVDASLLMLTQQEARAGARIVVWPESGAAVLQEDEAAFLQAAQSVARTSGIYLDMGLGVILPRQTPPFGRDESVLIDPSGTIVAVYQKAHPTPDERLRLAAGNGRIPVVTTPYGHLATAVCQDLNFLDIVHSVGQANADILIGPTGDWREIDPYHTQALTFTAIETGASLATQVDLGRSVAVDYEGNVLAATDFYSTDPQVMVAYVPIHGVHTLYDTIGDLVAWLSVVGLVALLAVAIAHRSRVGQADAEKVP
ncbi:MAG: nitrilase [Chloroflexi bacterium]|nr:MAG: nitrilase [Chloroflexota bacterium]